jgi:hypothetical protein
MILSNWNFELFKDAQLKQLFTECLVNTIYDLSKNVLT